MHDNHFVGIISESIESNMEGNDHCRQHWIVLRSTYISVKKNRVYNMIFVFPSEEGNRSMEIYIYTIYYE